MRSFEVSRPRNTGTDFDEVGHAHDQRIVIPTKLVSIAESFEKKERSRFVTSQIPTDLTVQVHDITFYVHKYPLFSRCGYLSRLSLQPSDSTYGHDLKIDNFPGGPDTFETVLKFCYGLPIDLTPANVAFLRCASEFLEMNEDLEEGNLISKTEAFLTFAVLSSWRDSITVLRSCEPLSPWAENLQIVRRCSDSIAWKASRDSSTHGGVGHDQQWWFDDVSTLRIDYFVRVVTTIKAKGVGPGTIGACIMRYAEKWLPGLDGECDGHRVGYGSERHQLQLSILSGRGCNNHIHNNSSSSSNNNHNHNKDQRTMIESLVSILPPHREAVSCGFLLWMLKMAIVYSATPALITELEKRVGMALEDATVSDLMIPNYINGDGGLLRNSSSSSGEECSVHDVDVVQRIVEYFLMHDQQQKCANIAVGKLLDGYLAEIATDSNLSIAKFQRLGETLPQNARTCDDGLYRAIDTYLKTHPSLTEHERRRLCRVMDCEKLSLDACLHAAQNERLPLRIVVQVLFTEQVKMRVAIKGKDLIPSEAFSEQESSRSSTKKEIKSLKAEIEKMKGMLSELQRDYVELQQEFDKLNSQKSVKGWSSRWKKIKNSTFLNGKMDGDENLEIQPKQGGPCCRTRRSSIS
ncbi:BTB/POZ domain-containing protein DOT3 isoform X2 [Magnolia sinica]|uniref:BTB/POZ domain-containing protein DOT3 isoform X2 n=1 Tax=Magnolia sinica TaxID=86752 RepID=UPI00265B67BF|nr:BTB/POZ domain-containing protein DOT3 isoform X2 [Magnolia sinica]